jgi:predicted component of type VI protein secretion system
METSLSINRSALCAALTVLVCLSGCDLLNPEPQRTLREEVTAANNLADVLQTVRDAKIMKRVRAAKSKPKDE